MTIPCGIIAAITTVQKTQSPEEDEPPSRSKLWLTLSKIWSMLGYSPEG